MTQRTTIFEEGASQVITTEIGVGETTSDAIDVGSAGDVGVILPETIAGAALAVHVGTTADGTFYDSGVSLSPSAGVPSIAAADRDDLRPFRFLKFVSDAAPAVIVPTALQSDGIQAEAATVIDLKTSGASATGVLTGGDVLTIDSVEYTVVGGPYPPDDLDDTKVTNVTITPALEAATTDGQAVTVTTNPNRGLPVARTLIVVTKD